MMVTETERDREQKKELNASINISMVVKTKLDEISE